MSDVLEFLSQNSPFSEKEFADDITAVTKISSVAWGFINSGWKSRIAIPDRGLIDNLCEALNIKMTTLPFHDLERFKNDFNVYKEGAFHDPDLENEASCTLFIFQVQFF